MQNTFTKLALSSALILSTIVASHECVPLQIQSASDLHLTHVKAVLQMEGSRHSVIDYYTAAIPKVQHQSLFLQAILTAVSALEDDPLQDITEVAKLKMVLAEAFEGLGEYAEAAKLSSDVTKVKAVSSDEREEAYNAAVFNSRFIQGGEAPITPSQSVQPTTGGNLVKAEVLRSPSPLLSQSESQERAESPSPQKPLGTTALSPLGERKTVNVDDGIKGSQKSNAPRDGTVVRTTVY